MRPEFTLYGNALRITIRGMNWRNVLLIFRREVSDQVRDRRTLFMIMVLPVLLYPGLGIAMFQGMAVFSEQPRTVVVLNAEHLPKAPIPLLINDGKFQPNLFAASHDADTLRLVLGPAADGTSTAAPEHNESAGAHPPSELTSAAATAEESATLLAQAEPLRPLIEKLITLHVAEQTARAEGDKVREEKLDAEFIRIRDQLADAFQQCRFEVLLYIPADFGQRLTKLHADLEQHQWEQLATGGQVLPSPVILLNSANQRSEIAGRRVIEAVKAWEKQVVRDQLKAGQLSTLLSNPINASSLELASRDQVSASLWSVLCPALLVMMTLTGAFYPSIDLGAGEKERGTMETLLICPALRIEIVLGKFFTVMLFSICTAVLNLASLGMTGGYMASLASAPGANPRLANLSPPGWDSILWILVMLIPLSALFSALCLALATFARSSKEGQYYLTPLLMGTMGLTVFCLLPGMELEPFYSVLPIVGPSLLLRGLIGSSSQDSELYVYLVPILFSSCAYSLLALWWAIDQFGREEVLFREAERFDLRLWVEHLLREKEPTPSFNESVFCMIAIMFIQFATLKSMRPAGNPAAEDMGLLLIQLMMIQQIAIIATPSLLMALMLTTDFRRTLRLYVPRWSDALAAPLLAMALHPLVIEVASAVQGFFPKLPPSIAAVVKLMSSQDQPLWLVLLAFAVLPGICEELTFRGFMLSGFARSGRTRLAIVLSSLAFGVIHIIPQQVFNAAMLGMVIGLIAVRSGSLIPGVLFHIAFNATEVLRSRFVSQLDLKGPAGVWIAPQGHYQLPTLLLAAIAAALLLGYFWRVRPPAWSAPTIPEAVRHR